MITEPIYLGDSVYIQPWPDTAPGGLVLTTDTHRLSERPGNIIYLEPEIVAKLKQLLNS